MRPFELVVPRSLAEASSMAGKGVVYKAAGIDLLDRLKERVEAPEKIVNLLGFRAELARIERSGSTVRIGALATLTQVAEAEVLRGGGFGALLESAGEAATPQVRNRATVGGNLLQQNRCWYFRQAAFGCAHNGRGPGCLAQEGQNRYHAILGQDDCMRVHPSNVAPALQALGASVIVQGGKGERTLPLAELYPKAPDARGAEHTLQPDEILTAIVVPVPGADVRSAYRESREKLSFDWATTAAAVRLAVADGKVRECAIVLGAVAAIPWVAAEAAQSLIGKEPSRANFEAAAKLAFAGARPLAQNAYKVPVGQATLADALEAAARR
ncbi:MAG: FAD binding domain-containing protein [Planctomycetes bacterium]|nr:FAD binding domain-containing protein [Planctomycetota bacterium]